jgi:hypothetical protein
VRVTAPDFANRAALPDLQLFTPGQRNERQPQEDHSSENAEEDYTL